MALKEYSSLLRAPELELHHQIQFTAPSMTPISGDAYSLCKGYNQCIQSLANRVKALKDKNGKNSMLPNLVNLETYTIRTLSSAFIPKMMFYIRGMAKLSLEFKIASTKALVTVSKGEVCLSIATSMPNLLARTSNKF